MGFDKMNLVNHEKYRNLNMKDYVYNVLKENIMYSNLKPGMMLRKTEVANEFGVSRTPIREAFVKLNEDALIDVYPQSGTYISYIDLEKVDEAEYMRRILEISIIKLACEIFPEDKFSELEANLRFQELSLEQNNYINLYEYDNQFHKMIFAGCKKINIWYAIEQVSTHLNRLRILSLSADFNRSDIIKDHELIIKAIEEREVQKAEKVMKSHINRINLDLKKIRKEYPDFFKKIR